MSGPNFKHPYYEGYHSAIDDGVDYDENPYKSGTLDHDAWFHGWRCGVEDIEGDTDAP